MNPYILYEDRDILIADKPGGLLSVPGRGPEKQDCLVRRLMEDYPELLVIHRLDQGTSGLMVFGRNREAQRSLGRSFEDRVIRKEYEALLLGTLPSEQGRAEFFQRLDVENRPYQILDEERGKKGITEWRVKDVFERGDRSVSRVRFFPLTGRTHQLRLHSRELGAPIGGDPLYGYGEDAQFPRLMLHAALLAFPHPRTGYDFCIRLSVPF